MTKAVAVQPVRMSSKEIAELTGKEHRNVRRDIENMAAELSLSFEQKTLASTGGRPSQVYLLARREVEILLTGYSIPLRAKVIDRLHELEGVVQATQAPALPTNFAEALRLAAALEEEKETLRIQNEAMRPAAEVGQAVGARKRTTVMEFAKKLPGINTMQVQKTLAALGHLRKVDGHWSVYSTSKKFFTESFDGMGYSVITTTEKGQQLLTRLYLEGEFPMLKGRTPEGAAA